MLCTGQTPSDVPAQPSFKARSNTQPSCLDCVLVDAALFHATQSCGVGPARTESDYLFLELRLWLATPPPAASSTPVTTLPPALRWDSALQEPYAQSSLTEACQTLL